jgi:hypothetical protein
LLMRQPAAAGLATGPPAAAPCPARPPAAARASACTPAGVCGRTLLWAHQTTWRQRWSRAKVGGLFISTAGRRTTVVGTSRCRVVLQHSCLCGPCFDQLALLCCLCVPFRVWFQGGHMGRRLCAV